MNVITVRQGNKYGHEYVTVLGKMVAEHSDRTLLVLGDDDDAHVPLTQGYQGWHAKLELFRPDLEPLRPFLFLDLDTFILAPIQDFFSPPERLALIRDFNRKERSNSGVMKIPSNTDEIWASRRTDISDGDYLATFPHDRLQDQYPGAITSYKRNCKDGPAGRIMCFHGQPKAPNAGGWATEMWQSYLTKEYEHGLHR